MEPTIAWAKVQPVIEAALALAVEDVPGNIDGAWQGVGVLAVDIRKLVDLRVALRDAGLLPDPDHSPDATQMIDGEELHIHSGHGRFLNTVGYGCVCGGDHIVEANKKVPASIREYMAGGWGAEHPALVFGTVRAAAAADVEVGCCD